MNALFPLSKVPRKPGARTRQEKPEPELTDLSFWSKGPGQSTWYLTDTGELEIIGATGVLKERVEALNRARRTDGAQLVYRNGRAYGIAVPHPDGLTILPLDHTKEAWQYEPNTRRKDRFEFGGQP